LGSGGSTVKVCPKPRSVTLRNEERHLGVLKGRGGSRKIYWPKTGKSGGGKDQRIAREGSPSEEVGVFRGPKKKLEKLNERLARGGESRQPLVNKGDHSWITFATPGSTKKKIDRIGTKNGRGQKQEGERGQAG